MALVFLDVGYDESEVGRYQSLGRFFVPLLCPSREAAFLFWILDQMERPDVDSIDGLSLAPYTLLPERCRLVERAHVRSRVFAEGLIAGTRRIMLGSRGVNRLLRHYGRGASENDSMLLI